MALTIAVALSAGAFACASPAPAPTTLTAADVPRVEEKAAAQEVQKPAGQLACRSTNAVDGTSELYLEWQGDAAKGTLRRTAPSGSITEQPVKAERYKDMIIADEPGSNDLVEHAATVRTHEGKPYIRFGGYKGGWLKCE